MRIEEELIKSLVEGISQGLKVAKIEKQDNTDKFDNSEPFRKNDKIMTALDYKIRENENFETKEFYRGGYKLLLAYDKEKHRLFSFMREDRLRTLINSKKIKDKTNYVFSLMQFNPDERKQQVMFEDEKMVLDEWECIQNRVRTIIEEDKEIEYITVLYKIVGYELHSIRLVKMSQYAEELESMDLSNYITIDFGDVYEDFTEEKEQIFDDLEFTFKDEILINSKNLEVNLEFEEKEEEIKNE